MNPPDGGRIATLDQVRGVAVLGILLMNIVAFAMPEAAYYNPAAFGSRSPIDYWIWAANALLVDGRMRGLFSMLFGASLLLVADRAEASGRSAAVVHYSRMAWLFVFGIAHLFLVWWGDILHHYAIVGCIAFLFRRWPARPLLLFAALLIAAETLWSAGLPIAIAQAEAAVRTAHPAPAAVADYRLFADAFGIPSPAAIARDLADHRGNYAEVFRHRWPEALAIPWRTLSFVGPETLAYMLIGMAGLNSGLLTGGWSRIAYRRLALACFALTLPCYLALVWWTWASGFALVPLTLAGLVLSAPLRPVAIVGWACVVILLARPGGALTSRLEAAGRMAFTNYLATSLVCTTLFYGYGLGWYGEVPRAALYLVVLALWVAMLAWSRPWLARFRFGPMEWLWRSLARGRWQSMRA
jgi:uncharacterized protein